MSCPFMLDMSWPFMFAMSWLEWFVAAVFPFSELEAGPVWHPSPRAVTTSVNRKPYGVRFFIFPPLDRRSVRFTALQGPAELLSGDRQVCLAGARGALVSDLGLPFARHFQVDATRVNPGCPGCGERCSVVHNRHRTHR